MEPLADRRACRRTGHREGCQCRRARVALRRVERAYGTHHIGASTEQAQLAIADETVRIVEQFVRTGSVPNVVNLCGSSPAKRMLIVRHRNRPGVLAHILGEISHAGINVEEMENVIFADAQAACAKIRLDNEPSPEVTQCIKDGCEHILAWSLMTLGD